ncbi:acyl-CoA dehydrogenase [Arsenicitalea aurantiaca]|uniref:Acyl-coenzyme A dehydrogenase n=1 Tax=Arsenicitalea aurantiaca TaxID=1783274 RepID=A0A433XG48_9HYPH|nr:acyl-CoA dehydrogenase [Arsenicitalea aurantiaca]RUT33079.1 acyl-CoA dehydrogenase [Arsenicitalea aurantiaca]
MVLVLVCLSIVAFFVLAMRRAPLIHWAVAALVIGILSRIDLSAGVTLAGGLWGWIFALLPGIILALLSVTPIRQALVSRPAYGMVRKILPRVSRTEQEALDAGTVGWDAELFSGRPRWEKLSGVKPAQLTAEEQAFLDGPVTELCAMIDDWDTRHNRADLSPEVWAFLKEKGFFGMLIGKEHGGLGFSAQAQSMVVSKIASRSVAAGITVMVPNSLGPGELLEKYGTDAQKEKYLRRLATGQDVPCFALTGPHAGSDAAGMRDIGVVTYDLYEGKKTLGVKLSWDKRYITLAPVASLLGLAFHLTDPEHLLGAEENVGITLALVPADHKGVEIGRRHFPARSAFMNGPTRGRNVFIPMDFLIGGPRYAGQGWRMLMECLSTGRAISLPAIGTTSIKQALRVTSAYARVRRQFGIPVGIMEGVADPLSRMVKSAYKFEAGRSVTAAMVDEGQKPSVLSAILKYQTTEAMRDRVNDAMDIHGGRAVQDGPTNYLFSGYATTPVAITVEGANILTRTLITFAQGALRAHPYLYKEIAAAQDPDRKYGVRAFDAAFTGHVSFMLRNIAGSFLHGLTGGRFASTPVDHEMAHWYRQLARYSQSFALVGDWTVAFLGGDLKRKQRLSGRMADILSELYLLSATLKRYEDEGRIEEDRIIVEAVAADAIKSIEDNFAAVFANFPNRVLAFLMGLLVFPLGRHARPASDKANYRLARAVLRPGGFRDRLTDGVYVSTDPKDVTGVLEDAFLKVTRAEEIEAKFVRVLKKGVIHRRLDRDAISDAVTANILTPEEASILRQADEATDRAIRVDDFEFDALAPRQLSDAGRIETAAE